MAAVGSHEGTRKATGRAKLPTSVMNQHLLLDWDHMKEFTPEHLCELMRIYHVCSLEEERAQGLLDDIVFLNSITTCHCS
jgi:hypothetical protein